jgi:hypothetical protein
MAVAIANLLFPNFVQGSMAFFYARKVRLYLEQF